MINSIISSQATFSSTYHSFVISVNTIVAMKWVIGLCHYGDCDCVKECNHN